MYFFLIDPGENNVTLIITYNINTYKKACENFWIPLIIITNL